VAPLQAAAQARLLRLTLGRGFAAEADRMGSSGTTEARFLLFAARKA
jgi:hypothetical protein